MTVKAPGDAHHDPYDVEINIDPYSMFRRLREEAPLYYNEQYNFYAISSSRGTILEIIKSGVPIPPGIILFEDPPIHDIHRRLVARIFTPRKISALEPKIRELCVSRLDPLVDGDRFDFVADLGAPMPMRVMGMLLGIPEDDQDLIRDFAVAQVRTEEGKPMRAASEGIPSADT